MELLGNASVNVKRGITLLPFLRLVELLLQAIEPLVKALMELVAECIPLFSCTDLLKRDNLSSSHG
jgi:hypothetical protein